MKAVIYARWSSLEQGKGSSLERQMDLCERFCAEQGWEIVDRLRDEGKSAYTGANLQEGQLAQFTQRVEQGLLRDETVLVVEQLDRISRLPPGQVIAWIQRVIGHGLTIATANDKLVLDSRKLEVDPIGIVSTVFNAFRAFQESKHKSDRIAESWRIRRKAAEQGKPITSVCPAWLTLDRDTGKFAKIPERVEIIKRIFREYDEGFGKRKIASRLNAEGIAPWGRGDSKGDGWHPSYVQKILSNVAVLGEYQPHTRPRGGKREPSGDPIPNYFPPIIDEVSFARANSGRRRLSGGAIKGNLSNLFSGLTRCGVCGGKMTFVKKQSAGAKRKNRAGEFVWSVANDQSYLVCSRAIRHLECDNRNHFNYLKVEAGVVETVNHLVLDDEQFERPDEALQIEQEMVALERRVGERRRKAHTLLELYGETNNADVKSMWRQTQDEIDEHERRLAELREQFLSAKGAVSPVEHVRRIQKFIEQINDEDLEIRLDARRKTMTAMNAVIDFINFDRDRKATVVFMGGAHNVKLSDKGAVEQEFSFLVQLTEGDQIATLNDGTELVAPVSALRDGLVGDDPVRQSKLDKLVDREQRFRTGMAELEAEEQKEKSG
ncbi:recombinase family protein [Pelagibacterium mangrovi]|uniref:recombinase family protein n=1 Tax=Pelagibacterium mangrovi TaxID=3119828 RepID=UPI002FC71651